MKVPEIADERYTKMTTSPVGRLILSMATPAIASMIVTALYNMADTYFVSRLGTSATAAPGIAMPLFQIIQAISLAFAIGAGSFAARALGRKDNEAANRSVSTAFFSAIFLCAVIGLASIIFLRPILSAFGATGTVLPYAWDYAFWVIIATPFFSASFVLNQAIRQEGSVKIAVIGTLSGAAVNCVLDPLLIFGCNMGIIGAAVATSISQAVSFLILFSFVLRGRSVLRIAWKYFTPRRSVLSGILKIGAPDFFRTALLSMAGILLNNAASTYGDVTLAGMTVVSRVMNLSLSVLMGIGQGFQPMCGYCYGAKLYRRVLAGLRFTLRLGLSIFLTFAVVGILFADPIMGLFRAEDMEFRRVGAQILRAHLLVLPLASVTILANMLFQSCGKAGQSAVLALSRNGVFFIPLILALPPLLGFTGVISAQPIAEVITFLLALWMLLAAVRQFKRGVASPPGKIPPANG